MFKKKQILKLKRIKMLPKEERLKLAKSLSTDQPKPEKKKKQVINPDLLPSRIQTMEDLIAHREKRLERKRARKARRLARLQSKKKKQVKENRKQAFKVGKLPTATKHKIPTNKAEFELEYTFKEWKARRKEIIRRDYNTCTACPSKKDLQVHHLAYQRGFHVWEYTDAYLVTLCDSCHEKAHKAKPIEEFYNNGPTLPKFVRYETVEIKPVKYKTKAKCITYYPDRKQTIHPVE